jgi:tetratricopeptide (TPR) repeat protein
MNLERRSEAQELLRRRARGNAPSPELLRTFARLLGPQPGDYASDFTDEPDEHRSEALDALRAAAANRADPMRPMTLYNLSALLSDEGDESERALKEAMAASPYYRRAWYARRTRGASHWHAGQRALAAGQPERAKSEFREAARWYSAAIRARPRFRVWYREWTTMTLRPLAHFSGSPILHGNAEDAHRAASHRLRAWWHRWRAERGRRKWIKRGDRRFEQHRWTAAYAAFDFAVIGRRDVNEAYASVMRAYALQQLGEFEAASAGFANADERHPDWSLPLRLSIFEEYGDQLPHGFPGDGPMDRESVRAELRRRGYQLNEPSFAG